MALSLVKFKVLIFMAFLIVIGLIVLTIEEVLWVIAFPLVIVFFHRVQKSKLWRNPQLKKSMLQLLLL